jgi:hypothetical protein
MGGIEILVEENPDLPARAVPVGKIEDEVRIGVFQ